MTAELLENFFSRALFHRLRNKITDPVREQGVTPKDLNISRLLLEVGLMWQDNRHQPIGVLECN
jgi:hypothetical protein